MSLETLFRVFVAGVLVVAPTLLFLGLWRGMMALRDGDLVNRTMNGDFGPVPESPITAAMFGYGGGQTARIASSTAGGQVRCGQCSAVNPEYADFCGNCLNGLD